MTAPRRPRLATVWLGGCSGCHMSFLDLNERLLELAARADVVYSPITDAKTFPEDVDVVLVEGAVANAEHLEMLRRVRTRSRVLVALGDCAVTGNVTALRNLVPVGEVLRRAYVDRADTQPGPPTDVVPPLLDRVAPLHRVVDVDVYLPGCPPSADHIWAAVAPLLDGQLPERAPGSPAPKFGQG